MLSSNFHGRLLVKTSHEDDLSLSLSLSLSSPLCFSMHFQKTFGKTRQWMNCQDSKSCANHRQERSREVISWQAHPMIKSVPISRELCWFSPRFSLRILTTFYTCFCDTTVKISIFVMFLGYYSQNFNM